MSFISVPALDRLLEPSDRSSPSTPSTSSGMDRESVLVRNRSMPFYSSYPYSSPPTPPPPRPRTPSPSSFSPSPYVLNFKRRVFGSTSNSKAVPVYSERDASQQSASSRATEASKAKGEAVSDNRRQPASTTPALKERLSNGKTVLNEDGMLPVREVRERLRPRINEKFDKLNSSRGGEGKSGGLRKEESGTGLEARASSSRRPVSHQDSGEEFFDAPEAPLSDYTSDEEDVRLGPRSARSSSSMRGDADGNLEWQLDQEMKRRIAAEDAMAVLQQQHNEMACHLAFLDGGGLGLIDDERDVWDAAQQAQKLTVTRIVASSVARGAVRAEAEEELECVVADKNREVARLRDKLQYYELVNHEMSQRNQEAIENARRRRHRRRSRNRWLMGCAGAAVCVGVSAALAYQFVPWAKLRVHAGAALQLPSRPESKETHPSIVPPNT